MKKIQRLPQHLIAYLEPEELQQVLLADCEQYISASDWLKKVKQSRPLHKPRSPERLVRGWLNEPL